MKKFVIFVVIMLILGIVNIYILLFLSVILMLAGVSAMYDVGTVLSAWFGRTEIEKKTLAEKALFDSAFYEGVILSGGGLGLLMLTFYAMSMGWHGLLSI